MRVRVLSSPFRCFYAVPLHCFLSLSARQSRFGGYHGVIRSASPAPRAFPVRAGTFTTDCARNRQRSHPRPQAARPPSRPTPSCFLTAQALRTFVPRLAHRHVGTSETARQPRTEPAIFTRGKHSATANCTWSGWLPRRNKAGKGAATAAYF